jgi:hypothetical protein
LHVFDNLPQENEKIRKVVLSGTINSSYTFRKQLYDDIINKNIIFSDIIEDNVNNGIMYYKHMNKYYAGFVTTADKPLNMVIYKFLELFALKILVFGNCSEYLQEYGFIPSIHYVEIPLCEDGNTVNIEELNKKINYYLFENTDASNKMIQNAYNLIKKKYTTRQIVINMMDTIKLIT